ncbi:MAG: nucleotide-diphospho-sugar transferase [Candidatus Methylacidiphilales bacterium]|nr:hypothetical protein [Candidatus Methylacidiphilales bacterium]
MSLPIPAVLLLTFNRPDVTAQVFAIIRQAKPKNLYVASDGPRPGRSDDEKNCKAVRDIIAHGVDWPCEVKTLYRQENLGCGKAVSSAITWYFEQVEEGIILEDDTLPSPAFFSYCAALLERYRDNPSVHMISGDNFQFGRKRGMASYYASRFAHIWGWASWRRAWNNYKFEIPFNEDRWQSICKKWNFSAGEEAVWRDGFLRVKEGRVDTWDYQWQYTLFDQNQVCLLPNVNLVSNLGFRADASHTKDSTSFVSNLPVEKLGYITHPGSVDLNQEADDFTSTHVFQGKPMPKLTSKESAQSWMWKLAHLAI